MKSLRVLCKKIAARTPPWSFFNIFHANANRWCMVPVLLLIPLMPLWFQHARASGSSGKLIRANALRHVASLLRHDDLFKALIADMAKGSLKGEGAELPKKRWCQATGFSWVDTLKSVNCDPEDKKAKCVKSFMATMVTKQVMTSEDECAFVVRVINAGPEDEPIIFGIVDDEPDGFSRLPIGHPELRASIGAACMRSGGAIVHQGKVLARTPGLRDGDIVSVRVKRGSKVALYKGSQQLHGFGVGGNGKFRIAVSMGSPGQKVEILDETPTSGYPAPSPVPAGPTGYQKLTVGSTVRLPMADDPRLQEMRTKFVDSMRAHCGRVGKVLKVKERLVTVEVDDDDYHWDLEAP